MLFCSSSRALVNRLCSQINPAGVLQEGEEKKRKEGGAEYCRSQWVGGSIFDCAQRSSYEAQVPMLGEIYKMVRIQHQKALLRILKSNCHSWNTCLLLWLHSFGYWRLRHSYSTPCKNSMQASYATFLEILLAQKFG